MKQLFDRLMSKPKMYLPAAIILGLIAGPAATSMALDNTAPIADPNPISGPPATPTPAPTPDDSCYKKAKTVTQCRDCCWDKCHNTPDFPTCQMQCYNNNHGCNVVKQGIDEPVEEPTPEPAP